MAEPNHTDNGIVPSAADPDPDHMIHVRSTDDIVTRLRHAEENGICEWQVLIDAAAEIERLRAAGDALAEASTIDLCDCENEDCTALLNANHAWREARQ